MYLLVLGMVVVELDYHSIWEIAMGRRQVVLDPNGGLMPWEKIPIGSCVTIWGDNQEFAAIREGLLEGTTTFHLRESRRIHKI